MTSFMKLRCDKNVLVDCVCFHEVIVIWVKVQTLYKLDCRSVLMRTTLEEIGSLDLGKSECANRLGEKLSIETFAQIQKDSKNVCGDIEQALGNDNI